MSLRVLGGLIFTAILVLLTSCATAQPLPLAQAQTTVADTWQTDQHVVWVLDWPAAPDGGPVTVETWRTGDSFRYEILEAVAPALIGETLVFNGQTAWQYNRFDPDPPIALDPPRLSPISDAFAVIDRLITTLPQLATQEAKQTVHGPAQKITLTYVGGDQLALWRDDETQLPVKIAFLVDGKEAMLNVRDFEPLIDPPPGMFELGGD